MKPQPVPEPIDRLPHHDPYDDAIDLRVYVRLLSRYRLMVAAAMIVCGALGNDPQLAAAAATALARGAAALAVQREAASREKAKRQLDEADRLLGLARAAVLGHTRQTHSEWSRRERDSRGATAHLECAAAHRVGVRSPACAPASARVARKLVYRSVGSLSDRSTKATISERLLLTITSRMTL
jgi:hypothetical protein